MSLIVANKKFTSRLIVGSGKYKDFETTKQATLASGSEMITVAVRRVNIMDKNAPNLLDFFKDTTISFLPNSAGCTTAKEAITLLILLNLKSSAIHKKLFIQMLLKHLRQQKS